MKAALPTGSEVAKGGDHPTFGGLQDAQAFVPIIALTKYSSHVPLG